jgi:putative ABC transport system permease protein
MCRPADHETPFLLIGFDPILDRDLRRWTVQSPGKAGGRLGVDDAQPGTMMIGAGWASSSVGVRANPSNWSIPGRRRDFKVLARWIPKGLALVEGGRIALCDIATFQEFTGLFGLADRVD